MQKKLVGILFSVISICVYGQTNNEAVLQRLKVEKEDTTKVKLLIEAGELYVNNDPSTAFAYFRQANALATKLDYKSGIYRSLVHYGAVFVVTGNLDSFLHYNFRAYEAAKLTGDSLNIGIALFNIGVTYRDRSEFEKALEYCLKGLSIIEKQNDLRYEVQLNDAMQILYQNRSEYDKAIAYGKKAVRQSRELKDTLQLVKSLTNLSRIYSDTKKLDTCFALLKEAERFAVILNQPWITATILTNLSGYAIMQRNYPEARRYAVRCLELSRLVGDESAVATCYRIFGLCDLQEGNLDRAKQYTDSALVFAQRNGLALLELSLLRTLSVIEYARHNYEGGFTLEDKVDAVIEKMVKDVLSERSSELEKKYEAQKQQAAIKTLQAEKKVQQLTIRQKNIINYVLTGCAIVLVLLSALIFRTQKQKQKLQQQRISELETEKQLAATEAVLKGEEQERSRLAKELHDGLGGILSGIKYSFNTMKGNLHLTPENQHAFEKGIEMLDVSIKEMRRVAHNMMPEALMRFGLDAALRDFCNDINQSGALKISYQSIGLENEEISHAVAIPVYRIVQELVSNSIKHAEAQSAIIQLSNDARLVSITVEDDGKGFDISSLEQTNGIGWSNIRSRVEYLKGQLYIQSEPDKGTSVHVEFPSIV